jgi:hypothetical protein
LASPDGKGRSIRCCLTGATSSPSPTKRTAAQYDFIDSFIRHLRDELSKASFIAFTGTLMASGDKNTQAVFGDLGGVPNTCEFD